jgi:hypothetical protein
MHLAAMWGMIVATTVQFKGVIGNIAVVLLGPYLLWVSYASALTIWIWQHNLPSSARKVGRLLHSRQHYMHCLYMPQGGRC